MLRYIFFFLMALVYQQSMAEREMTPKEKHAHMRMAYYMNNLMDPNLNAFLDTLRIQSNQENNKFYDLVAEYLLFMQCAYGDSSMEATMHHVEEEKKIAKELGYTESYFVAASNEIAIYLREGHILTANKLVVNMLNEAKELNHKKGIELSHMALSNLYETRGDHFASYNVMKEVLDTYKKQPNKPTLTELYYTYNILSERSLSIGHYKECIEYADSCLKLTPTALDIVESRARANYQLGRYADFEKDYARCRELTKKGHSTPQPDYQMLLIGLHHILHNESSKAEALIDSVQDKEVKLILKEEIALNSGNYKKAYELMKTEMMTKDSLRNLMYSNDIDDAISQLGASELKHEAEIQRIKARRTQLVMLIVVLCFIIGGIYILSWSRKRNAKRLKQTNMQLNAANTMVKNTLKQLETASGFRRNFVSNITSELRQTTMTMYGYAQLVCDNGQDMTQDELTEIRKLIEESYQHMEKFLRDINETVSWDEMESEPTIGVYTVNDLARQAIKEEWARPWEECPVDFSTKVLDDVTLKTDYYRAKIIIRRIIHYAYRDADDSCRVKIQCTLDEHGKNAIYSISQTSSSMPHEIIKQLFERFIQIGDKQIEGLYVIRNLAKTIGMSVWVDETFSNQGTRFCISAPL